MHELRASESSDGQRKVSVKEILAVGSLKIRSEGITNRHQEFLLQMDHGFAVGSER